MAVNSNNTNTVLLHYPWASAAALWRGSHEISDVAYPCVWPSQWTTKHASAQSGCWITNLAPMGRTEAPVIKSLLALQLCPCYIWVTAPGRGSKTLVSRRMTSQSSMASGEATGTRRKKKLDPLKRRPWQKGNARVKSQHPASEWHFLWEHIFMCSPWTVQEDKNSHKHGTYDVCITISELGAFLLDTYSVLINI